MCIRDSYYTATVSLYFRYFVQELNFFSEFGKAEKNIASLFIYKKSRKFGIVLKIFSDRTYVCIFISRCTPRSGSNFIILQPSLRFTLLFEMEQHSVLETILATNPFFLVLKAIRFRIGTRGYGWFD